MSRRSLYKPGRANTSLYGPKTDSTIVHWSYDWVELATTRDEESEGLHNANTFRVKTWHTVPTESWVPVDDGIPGDELVLFNQMQTTVDEIARKDADDAANMQGRSETPETKTNYGLQTLEPTPEPIEADAMEVDTVVSGEAEGDSKTPAEPVTDAE